MDTTVLSEQHLKQMEAFAPDKKEVNQAFLYIVHEIILPNHPL